MKKILFFAALLICSIGLSSASAESSLQSEDKIFEYVTLLLSILVAVAYFGVAVMAWLWYKDITERLLKFLAMGFTLSMLGMIIATIILLNVNDVKVLVFYLIQLSAALYFLAGMWMFMKSTK